MPGKKGAGRLACHHPRPLRGSTGPGGTAPLDPQGAPESRLLPHRVRGRQVAGQRHPRRPRRPLGCRRGAPGVVARAHGDDANGFTQVLSVAFSPDGKTLASGGWDRAVRLWDTANGALKRTLSHENLVYSVAFSPDGRTLASGEHQTGAIRLWEVETGKSAGVLVSGRGSVWSAAFAPDGTALASGGYVVRRGGGGVVRLWDLSRRAVKWEIPAQSARQIAFSPDGRLLAGTGDTPRAGGHGIDGLVRLWDARTGALRHTWTVVGDGRSSAGPVAFSPDGRLVAVGGEVGERAKERKAGEIHLWDIESDLMVWSQSCHDDDVTCLAFTPTAGSWLPGGVTRSSSCGKSPS